MSIREIDAHVMVNQSTNIAKINSDSLKNPEAYQQSQFKNIEKDYEDKEFQVLDTKGAESARINVQQKKNNGNGKNRNSQKKQHDKDQTEGNNIDITI